MANFKFPKGPPISVVWLSGFGVVLSILFTLPLSGGFPNSQESAWREISPTEQVTYVYASATPKPDFQSQANFQANSYEVPTLTRRSSSSSAPEFEEEYYDLERDDHREYRRRSATSSHGRSVLFKSLVLAPLALVVLFLMILLVIPVPVISNPVGRSLDSSSSTTSQAFSSAMQMARDVLGAEECVERISCELSRISRNHNLAWIPENLERLLTKNHWGDKIIRGIQRTSRSDSNSSSSTCKQFTCNAAKNIKRSLSLK